MKKRNLVLVILAILLVFGMVSCGDLGDDPDAVSVTLTVSADGSTAATTKTLTLTFSEAITNLAVGDITLSGASVTKGTLGGTGSTYTLGISGVKADGTLNVKVTKKGYIIPQATVQIKISNSDKALLLAETYFGQYQTTYKLGNPQVETNEFVIIDNTSGKYVIKIEEKQNTTLKDWIYFDVNNDGWEIVSVPQTVVNIDPSERGDFTIGFKIKGKITSISGGYEDSKSAKGFKKSDENVTECWMYIYLNDTYYRGDLLIRSPFSSNNTGQNNEAKLYIDGNEDTPVVRIYEKPKDDDD